VEAVNGEVENGIALDPLREHPKANYFDGRASPRSAKEID